MGPGHGIARRPTGVPARSPMRGSHTESPGLDSNSASSAVSASQPQTVAGNGVGLKLRAESRTPPEPLSERGVGVF